MTSVRLLQAEEAEELYGPRRETWPEERARWRAGRMAGSTWIRRDGRADSVQWLDLPGEQELDLAWVERHYFAWVPRLAGQAVHPHYLPDGGLELAPRPLDWPRLIRMAPVVSEEDAVHRRRIRPIRGGFLAKPGGSLEFELLRRPAGRRLVVAVRALSPRLPLGLYLSVQTPMHERSTFAFLREVNRRYVAQTLGLVAPQQPDGTA